MLYNAETDRFDRSAIMRDAWKRYRTANYECVRRSLAKGFMPKRFQNCLKAAWALARSQRNEAHEAPEIRAARLRREAFAIECTDRDGSTIHYARALYAQATQLDQIAA